MTLLQPAHPAPRLFAGVYGVEGSGKTYTATTLACYARHRLELPGPIAALDTEKGMGFRAPYVKDKTGQDLLALETRDIDKVIPFLKECAESNVSVAIIDSFTHVLTTLRDRYFNSHGISDPQAGDYVAADKPFRESQVYGRYKNTKGKWVNGPVGTKMGAGKAGYEVDLLLHLQRETLKGGGIRRFVDVEKDRSDQIVGNTFDVPYDIHERMGAYFNFLLGGAK